MSDDQDRYARHHLIDWWDQDRLRAARVMVAGAGAIGNEVIKLLALMGVGHILIVDYDRIELSNLTRSVLFREADIGKSKARVAAARARDINPDVRVIGIDGDLEFDIGLGVYAAMDVVIGCLDSINARLAVNRACRRVGAPWLNGGIEVTVAEIALYGGADGPCYACALSPEMWQRRNRRYSCTRMRADAPEDRMPTTAVVASLAASYLVNEALLLLHATPEQPTGKLGLRYGQKLYLMLKPYSLQQLDLPCDPDCYAHERYEPVEVLTVRPAELTVRELLQRLDLLESTIELGYDLLTTVQCVQCGRSETVMRPLERCPETLSHCPACNALTRQTETVSWVDAHSDLADCTLAQLGVPDNHILAIKSEDNTRYIQFGPFNPLNKEALWNEAE
jgi:molybdopterin/thiamine biosynthesis adenylyltransferase